MLFQKALIIVILLANPALALAFVKAITVVEAVSLYASQSDRWLSPDDVIGFTVGPEYIEHLKWQFNQLADKSLPVLQVCVNKCDLEEMCQAPQIHPHPLFPLSESTRNTLLGRPSSDVIRTQIERATNGELSTVSEIVEKLNANIRNLSAMSDDEMMLLASNFHHGKAGWTIDKDCRILDGGPWSEDLLMSQDEQRALTAGFLYVYRDQGYRDRREDAMREEILRRVIERQEQAKQQDIANRKNTDVALHLFIERVTRLEDEAAISKEEWLAQYDEYLAALRARLEDIAAKKIRKSPHTIGPLIEILIGAAEDVVDRVICSHVPLTESGFRLFIAESESWIPHESQEVRQGMRYKLTYYRWKALSGEVKADYIRADVPQLNAE